MVEDLGFGETVRRARLTLGWNQAELAKRIGMSQRAVSNWEQGRATPKMAIQEQVLDVLRLRDPAGPGASRSETTYAGRALVGELPFERLSPGDFEEFTADLLKALNSDTFVHRQGKSGHGQSGYDVLVVASGALILGVQCKREAQFGPAKVIEAVNEARKATAEPDAEPVASSVIALSRIASPDARKEMRKHPGWQLWDRNDLSRMVRDLDLDLATRIIKRFFPKMLSDFLGVLRPGPWLDAEEYIERWRSDKIYTHRWRLVGPPDAVDVVMDFAVRDRHGIMLLTGAGGSGKTKVLTEVCARAVRDGIAVRILEPDTYLGPGSFEQLPNGPLLVIVDDAHDEDVPVGRLIAGVQKANGQANIVASLRPYGVARVRQQLRPFGHHIGDVQEVPVPELTIQSAAELAREALDEPVRHHGVRLAASASDCPLLIVTGAALINRGELDPDRFEDDERLHVELTDRLAEALTAQSAPEGPVRREVLTALAAYQPVDLADGQVRSSLERLTGLADSKIALHLSGLEEAGLVLRRGTVVRVVPDLLGDALLKQAAIHRGAGVLTGYLETATRSADGAAKRNLIVNAGRVDWQAGGSQPHGAGLIESLWQDLDAAFRSSDAIDRCDMFTLVAKVAFYQPHRTLAMVRWALSHPAEQISRDAGFGYTKSATDIDVRQTIAPVLRPIAWYPELLAEAAELLWELTLEDQRAPHQHPDHPQRVLQELASFTRHGSTDQQRTLTGVVDRLLNRCSGLGNLSPLTVLAPLLATSGHDEQWTPDALVFRPYTLLPTQEILQLRNSVLQMAFAQLDNPNPAWVAAAIDIIGAGITITPSPFRGVIEEQVKQAWYAHFASVLDQLTQHLTTAHLSPALFVHIRKKLQWTGEHGPDQLRRAAQTIAAALPVTPENTIARALHGGPVDLIDAPDPEARSQMRQNLFTDAVEAITAWPDEHAAERLNDLLTDEARVFGPDTGRARPFLWDLIISRPSLGAAVCAHAIREPESPLGTQMSITLVAMGKAGVAETIDWARRLVDEGRIEFTRAVAHALGMQRSRPDLLPGEAALLSEMAGHPDPIVAAAAVGAARHLSADFPNVALALVFTALPNGGLLEAVTIFGPNSNGRLTWDQLPHERKALILGHLAKYESFDEYEIGQFLMHITTQDPDCVIELLQSRVEHAEQGSLSIMSPVLPDASVVLPFHRSAGFPDHLRRIREWMAAAPTSWRRTDLGGRLFALVAGPFDDQALDVVFDYTDTPDPTKMQVVAAMLSRAPRDLVWNVEAVRRVLRAADRIGTDSLTAAQGALLGAASRGGRHGSPGQQFPEDIELRDRAEALAATCLPGSIEQEFYRLVAESAKRTVAWTVDGASRPNDHRSWS